MFIHIIYLTICFWVARVSEYFLNFPQFSRALSSHSIWEVTSTFEELAISVPSELVEFLSVTELRRVRSVTEPKSDGYLAGRRLKGTEREL